MGRKIAHASSKDESRYSAPDTVLRMSNLVMLSRGQKTQTYVKCVISENIITQIKQDISAWGLCIDCNLVINILPKLSKKIRGKPNLNKRSLNLNLSCFLQPLLLVQSGCQRA